jgi:hypothetical protein
VTFFGRKMEDHELDVETGPSAEEAAALVSKWLDDSEEDDDDEIAISRASGGSYAQSSALSRAQGYA